MHWSIINRFPRLRSYPKFKQLAQASLQVARSTRDRPRRPLPEDLPRNQGRKKPGAWSTPEATERLLAHNNVNFFLSTNPSTSGTIRRIPGLMFNSGFIKGTGFDEGEQLKGGCEEIVEASQPKSK